MMYTFRLVLMALFATLLFFHFFLLLDCYDVHIQIGANGTLCNFVSCRGKL